MTASSERSHSESRTTGATALGVCHSSWREARNTDICGWVRDHTTQIVGEMVGTSLSFAPVEFNWAVEAVGGEERAVRAITGWIERRSARAAE